MKRQIGIIMAVWLITSVFVHAQTSTSYLLVQGDFGNGGSEEETFKWAVSYPTGFLSTGQDLMNAVFGAPVYTGTDYMDAYGSYPEYEAQNGSMAVNYAYYGSSLGYGIISFTLGGMTLLQDPSDASNPSWLYYAAGGGGASGSDGSGAPYPDGSWTFANDGLDSRLVSNASFDGWVFGDPGFSDGNTTPIDGATTGNAPLASNFDTPSPTDFIISVPEPSALPLAVIALGVLALRRKRIAG